MSKQTINIGASPNDGTGTPLRTSFDYTNQNFTELYTAVGPSGNNIVVPGNATITGNLTVQTNKLAVTSTGVGCGTSSPLMPLDVRGGAGAGALFLRTTDPTAAVSSAYIQTPVSTGFSALVPIYGFWYQNSGMGNPAADTLNWIISSAEAMRLNSTGLGIGVSPSYNIDVLAATLPTIAVRATSAGASNARFYLECAGTNSGHITYNRSLQALQLGANGGTTAQVTLDSVGNVGIGVTPNAGWQSSWKALDIGLIGGVSYGFGQTDITSNVYRINTGAARYKAAATAATSYTQVSGTHNFLTAGVSTNADDPIAFNTSFTINASGLPIFLATTTTPATLTTNGELTFTATSNTNLRFSYRGSDGTTRVANLTLA